MSAIAIVAPPYRETSGGRVVLHRLFDVLCNANVPAYMVPLKVNDWPEFRERYPDSWVRKTIHSADDVVIYPDIVMGNPFGASRVVRWQLYHQRHPVGHRDRVFHYVPAFGPGPYLRVTDPRLDVFTYRGGVRERDWCWTWRKAAKQGWAESERPREGIEIFKGLPLAATSETFQKCRRFVTYDNATFLAVQARLTGCIVEIRSRTPVDPYLASLVAMHPDALRAHLIQKCADEDAAAIATCRELIEWK